jgi:hypothetical protein
MASFKKRRFPRVPAEHSILVRLLGGPRFEGFARTRTIGLGGCMFVIPESLGYGSLIELLIAVDGRVLKTDARVAYEIRKGRSQHQVGVEFLRVAPGDRAVLDGLIAAATGSR